MNVELPRMSNPRADMLARTAGGVLCNLELQSTNSGAMAQRQAEYYLDLHRLLGGMCGRSCCTWVRTTIAIPFSHR